MNFYSLLPELQQKIYTYLDFDEQMAMEAVCADTREEVKNLHYTRDSEGCLKAEIPNLEDKPGSFLSYQEVKALNKEKVEWINQNITAPLDHFKDESANYRIWKIASIALIVLGLLVALGVAFTPIGAGAMGTVAAIALIEGLIMFSGGIATLFHSMKYFMEMKVCEDKLAKNAEIITPEFIEFMDEKEVEFLRSHEMIKV